MRISWTRLKLESGLSVHSLGTMLNGIASVRLSNIQSVADSFTARTQKSTAFTKVLVEEKEGCDFPLLLNNRQAIEML